MVKRLVTYFVYIILIIGLLALTLLEPLHVGLLHEGLHMLAVLSSLLLR